MNPLTPCVVSEGTCKTHFRFRLTSHEFQSTALCPSCKRGEAIEMRLIGQGWTKKKLPFFEATDRIFHKWSNTVQMKNTENRLPEGM